LNRCTELDLVGLLFCFFRALPALFRKSAKRVLELEIQLENNRVASPVSSSGADSQSDMKDMAAFKIRIKSLERELQQKKQEAEKMEHKLTEQSTKKRLSNVLDCFVRFLFVCLSFCQFCNFMILVERTKASLETLNRKESEMQAMEERYKRYIEKAKMVLKTLDPKNNTTAVSPEMAALQNQLREKDRLIERLEMETERHKAIRETEDQLVTTAFYNLVNDIGFSLLGYLVMALFL
jgi:protein HOOK3